MRSAKRFVAFDDQTLRHAPRYAFSFSTKYQIVGGPHANYQVIIQHDLARPEYIAVIDEPQAHFYGYDHAQGKYVYMLSKSPWQVENPVGELKQKTLFPQIPIAREKAT